MGKLVSEVASEVVWPSRMPKAIRGILESETSVSVEEETDCDDAATCMKNEPEGRA
jgi:hypothetical protein